MPKETWIIASLLTILLLLGLLGFSSWDKKQRLEEAIKESEAARSSLQKAESETATLKQKIEEDQSRIAELQKEKEAVVQSHRSLEDEMRAALESKDVTI